MRWPSYSQPSIRPSISTRASAPGSIASGAGHQLDPERAVAVAIGGGADDLDPLRGSVADPHGVGDPVALVGLEAVDRLP